MRIRLKSYDSRVIDNACQKLLDVAIQTGAKVVGPVPLPTDRSVYVVNTSPFVDKNARDHFEMRIHKRLIDIISPTTRTMENLRSIELPSGVSIEVT